MLVVCVLVCVCVMIDMVCSNSMSPESVQLVKGNARNIPARGRKVNYNVR